MKALRHILRATGPIVDVLLPQRCWAGGAGAVEMGLSRAARRQIAELAAQPYCQFCGLSIGPYEAHDKRNPCGRCGTRSVGVDRIARAGTFSPPLVQLVHQLKFGKSWELADVVAPFLHQAIIAVAEAQRVAVDVLVPVPLHWSRRAARGFNQAEELARAAAALGDWRVANVLRRRRRTAAQAQADSVTQRHENLRGAFACRRGAARHVAGKHVWLIDDVSTTGATLHAAASALRALPRGEKPASISAAVLCITDHREPANQQQALMTL